MYDVAIIGGGVVGCLIARQLKRYDLKICLLEKENDVAMGTTKANSAIIHAGYDCKIDTLKAKFNVRGNEMIEDVVRDLDVPFKRVGSLVVAFSDADIKVINELFLRGMTNGVKSMEIWNADTVRLREPNLSHEIKGALFAPTAGIICPYELTIAAAEVAVNNGLDLMLNTCVTNISKNDFFTIETNKQDIKAKYIINAAGLFADKIASMIGDKSFKITPRKGEYIIFDKKMGDKVNRVTFQPPSKMGKGVLVTPTIDGNLMIGPTAQDILDKDDVSTTRSGLNKIMNGARKTYPDFIMRDIINSFSGLRAHSTTGDFIIGPSHVDENFINVAAIESPGLSAAPAIAQFVVKMIVSKDSKIKINESYDGKRRRVVRFRDLSMVKRDEIIKQDNHYGQIVCRCEGVTQGEIEDCIRRNAGARDLDGVKRRTRSGMGRCQGGFCMPRVMEILADELGIPVEKITKKGGNSKLVYKNLDEVK